MSISEEHTKKFGKVCKWLDYDIDCHRTKCVLNWARRDELFSRFEELKFNHPEFAYQLYSQDCSKMCGDYHCFCDQSKPDNDNIVIIDDIEYTELESQAMNKAKIEFRSNYDVRGYYKIARDKWIEEQKRKIKSEQKMLKEVKKEII